MYYLLVVKLGQIERSVDGQVATVISQDTVQEQEKQGTGVEGILNRTENSLDWATNESYATFVHPRVTSDAGTAIQM